MKINHITTGILFFLPLLLFLTIQNPAIGQVFTMDQIKNGLLNTPPDSEYQSRRQGLLLGLDSILLAEDSRKSQQVFAFYAFMMEKVNKELQNDSREETSIWMMYNHGFLVRTPEVVFAFDLIHGYEGWEYRLPPELLKQINVLFISHRHKDHFDASVANEVMAGGGRVVFPAGESLEGDIPVEAGNHISLSGLDIGVHDMLHIVPGRMYEVRSPNGLKFFHSGDNQTSETLPQVDSLDVLLLNAWVNESGIETAVTGMRNSIEKLKPDLMIPGHIQELSHSYLPGNPTSRVPYDWALQAGQEDMITDVRVMAWGERNMLSLKSGIFPVLVINADSTYLPERIQLSASQDGVVYLVPQNTPEDITLIRLACIDSAGVQANVPLNLSLSALENGTYWLYARNATGNISKPAGFSITGVGITRQNTGDIHIYPNPTRDLLRIETESPACCSIAITSLDGQLLYQGEMQGSSHRVDLSFFSEGVYLIFLKTRDYLCTNSFVKL